MTANVKVISKPKVRFCQFSDNARNKEEVLQEPCKQQAAVQTKNGPRIKEIVSLKKPIRIVDRAKSTRDTVGDKRVSLNTCNAHLDTSSLYGTGTTSAYLTTVPDTLSFSDKDVTEVESAMILRDANGTRNTTEESDKVSLVAKTAQSPRQDTLKERAKCLRQKGKENQIAKRPLKSATVTGKIVNETRTARVDNSQQRVRSCMVARGKFKSSPGADKGMEERAYVARPAFKGPKMARSQSASSVVKTSASVFQGEQCTAKSATTLPRITSCYKTAAKNRIAPVKKIVFRNVVGPRMKTSVESQVFHKEQDAQASAANENHTVASDILVQDLTQPEYNSIVCTINKLKELKQQKRVTAVTPLPSTLKSFLNGKISTALDFPLDEAIYKNLVDLSVDERHLPRTVKRSKDPEPRQKDLVPKLADFFIPEDTKEIYEAVHVKSQVSKIDNDWNAFKISDRILEWKYSIDDVD